MFGLKIFLFSLFLSIGVYFFSLFNEKDSSNILHSKAIVIEPIVISSSVKEQENKEVLIKLKKEVTDSLKHTEPPEEEVAKEVLALLKALLKSREAKKEKRLKEEESIKKSREIKENRAYLKRMEKEKQKQAKRRADAKHKEALKRKEIAQKRALKKAVVPQIKTLKEGILLGEQKERHSLSQEEAKKFHNLEVVFESKAFTLEETPKVKSPKAYRGVEENDVPLEQLPLVETLGVVKVSKPFTMNQ